MLTQETLKNILKYDPQTGIFSWVQTRGKRVSGARAGHVGGPGYRFIHVEGRQYYEHRLAVLYMTGKWPPHEVDHRNGNKLDNRWSNIRSATRTENMRNAGVRRDSTSKIPGVSFFARTNRWRAYINHNGQRHLGYFVSKEDAIAARQIAVEKLFGEFAYQGGLHHGA